MSKDLYIIAQGFNFFTLVGARGEALKSLRVGQGPLQAQGARRGKPRPGGHGGKGRGQEGGMSTEARAGDRGRGGGGGS